MRLRYRVGAACLFCLGTAALLTAAGGSGVVGLHGPAGLAAAEPPGEQLAALPPLVIGKDAPRLSEETAKPAAPAQGPTADNSACYCCHGNYREESFVQCHARANVGCIKCHGESLAHRNDEDNITPPDTMYPPQEIARNCKKCHESHDAPAAKVIAMWQQKCPARTNPKELLCTDCHGEHRLKFRTVWWDKKTGQLGAHQEGERVRWAPDLTKPPENGPTPKKRAAKPTRPVAADTEMH